MPRERRGTTRKRRTREHIIADLGVHHVEGAILRCGFTAQRIVHDYGLDLYMTTYGTNGEAESDWVLFQLKATDHLTRTADSAAVIFRIERADLNRWVAEAYPVILVVYDARADVGYWLYVQAHFAAGRVRGGASQKLTVHIPAANVLNEAAIQGFAAAKAAIQRQTKEVRHDEPDPLRGPLGAIAAAGLQLRPADQPEQAPGLRTRGGVVVDSRRLSARSVRPPPNLLRSAAGTRQLRPVVPRGVRPLGGPADEGERGEDDRQQRHDANEEAS